MAVSERRLVVPKGSAKKVVEKASWRSIGRLRYRGRTIEAYYEEPGGRLIGLKHICHVRMFNSVLPFYGYYENIFRQSIVEIYGTIDEKTLMKILHAHYGEISLSDIAMTPGSPYTTYSFSFHDPCIVVDVKNHEIRDKGKAIPINKKLPVDFMHYYKSPE